METDRDSVETDGVASFSERAILFIHARSYRLWLITAVGLVLMHVSNHVFGVPRIFTAVAVTAYVWWFFKASKEFVSDKGVS